jgi:hypothetical protein
MGPGASPGRRIIARSASNGPLPSLIERIRSEPPSQIHLRQPGEPALFRGVKADGHPRERASFEASPSLRDRYRGNKTSPIV